MDCTPRDISVVLTNYNGRDNLESYLPEILKAFEHVENQEVLVVDDASTDDSVAYLRENFPEVRVVVHEKNQGFPVTAHTGFTSATRPFVFLLCSDMVPLPGCIERMAALIQKHPDVLTVSGPQMNPDGSQLTGRFRGQFSKGSVRVKRHEEQPDRLDGKTLHQFQSAVGLYRKSVYEDVGGFCELFVPFYFEEVDLSFRAWKLGYRLLYDPEAKILHHTDDSSISKAHGEKARKAHHRIHQFYLTWKNINQPRYLLSHLVWLTGRILFSWTFGDWPFYRALGGYFKNRDTFARKRNDLLKRAKRTDQEVFSLSAQTFPA